MKPADDDGPGAYVRRVTQDTQRYAEELLEENHRLRARALVLDQDKVRLQERLAEVCAALDRHQRDQEQLQDSMHRVRAESQRFAEQYRDLESQNTNLANLYVASYRLHGTLDHTEILGTIQEIVANLVGSEESAVFEMDDSGALLALTASTGVDPATLRHVRVGEGLIGHCARTGQSFVSGDGPDPVPRAAGEAELTACVPLTLGSRVSGAIALFRLLPQKKAIEAIDRELFDLLATHAATALYCSALHARAGTAS